VGVVGGEGEQRCPEIEEVRAAMAGGAFEPRDENEAGSRTPPYRAIGAPQCRHPPNWVDISHMLWHRDVHARKASTAHRLVRPLPSSAAASHASSSSVRERGRRQEKSYVKKPPLDV
jgi:hypothetical protein